MPQGPNFESQDNVFPYTFCGLKTHSYVIPGTTMRKQAVAVCLKVLIAILWLPRRGDIQLEMSQQLAIVSHLHAPGVLKGGAKLLLSFVRKQLLGGVSSSCYAVPL